jgi:ankyrin repeat protein
MKILLDLGADPTTRISMARTALHTCAFYGCADGVPLLLAAGANIQAMEGRYMQTPLHVAAQRGHTEVVRKLLAGGADPNHMDRGSSMLLCDIFVTHNSFNCLLVSVNMRRYV